MSNQALLVHFLEFQNKIAGDIKGAFLYPNIFFYSENYQKYKQV